MPQNDQPDVGGAEMTLLSRGEFVQDVLARISAHTGARLKAEPDPGWQRVVIHVRNRLPRVILGDLAHLFASTWHAPTGSGPWRLVRNQRLQAHEASLLAETLDRACEPVLALVPYVREPIEKLRGLRQELDKDPLFRFGNSSWITMGHARAGILLFASLPAEWRRELLLEGRLVIPWEALNADSRRLAVTALTAEIAPDLQDGLPADVPAAVREIQQYGVQLKVYAHPVTGALQTYEFRGIICAAFDGFDEGVPAAGVTKLRGNPYLRGAAGWEGDLDAMSVDLRPFQSGPAPKDWLEVTERLMTGVNMPFYSDYFTVMPDARVRHRNRPVPGLAGAGLGAVMDRLCEYHDRLWWSPGDAIYSRSRAWFIEQTYEAPPAVLTLLERQLRATDRLSAAGVVELGGITWHQLAGLSSYGGYLEGKLNLSRAWELLLWAYPIHPFLQLCGTLSIQQKDHLMNRGLTYAEMIPAQQALFDQLVWAVQGPTAAAQHGGLRVEQLDSTPSAWKKSWYVSQTFVYFGTFPFQIAIPFPRPAAPRPAKQ